MSLLEVKNLNKSYGQQQVLKDFSLTLEKGKVLGLLGPNGSGKTTFIKSVLQFLKIKSGQIHLEGEWMSESLLKDIAYLPDHDFIPGDMSFEMMIQHYKVFFDDFDDLKARTLGTELGIDFNKKFKKLSKGTREKVQLVLTVSRNAKLYIFDEPIAGVDPAARELIIRTIINNYNKSSSVILCTHLIADVEPILDEFIFLKEGSVYKSGTVDEVREEQGKTLEDLFKEVFAC